VMVVVIVVVEVVFVAVVNVTVLVVLVEVVSVAVEVVAVIVDVVVVSVGSPCPVQSALRKDVPPRRKLCDLFATRGPSTSRLKVNCSTSLKSTVAATLACSVVSSMGSRGQDTPLRILGEVKTVPSITSSWRTSVLWVVNCCSKSLMVTFSSCPSCRSMSKIVKKKSFTLTVAPVSAFTNLASNDTMVPKPTLMLP